jgi:glycosyltransferase involved in cell wall biosynthesis
VCIPVYGAHEQFAACLESVLAHTPTSVPILVCDDASPDERSREFVRLLHTEHSLFYAARTTNVGFPVNVNGGFASADPADVIILNSDCVVADGWLEGLRGAAYTDSTVATATALTNHGSVVSVPERGVPLPELPSGWTLEQAAAAVRRRSLRLRPRLLTAVGHCMYVRRSALELVGDFDPVFSPGYGEEVDFSQRCLQAGLSHVAADDVLVLHHGGGSLAPDDRVNPVKEEHETLLAERYPYYWAAVDAINAGDRHSGPLQRALGVASRALNGLSVVIDARILRTPMTGTQLHVLELIAAVARSRQARVTAIVPESLSGYAARMLEGLPGVEVVRVMVGADVPPTIRADLVHRPYQVASASDLAFLAQLGDRLVITHQDLIRYRNPSYFVSAREWEAYRATTRRALGIADRVLFFSEHARDDALAEDLVDAQRARVIRIGVDHALAEAEVVPVRPAAAARLPDDAELILCIGTDFRHKNRTFALRVAESLWRRHGWSGQLVLVGPSVSHGSSRPAEARMLAERPGLADLVLDIGAVTEAEKEWLLRRARLVLYPTVYEGFGLIPFEAADHGVPCLWAPVTALSEMLPDSAAGVVPWDADATADRALQLMCDDPARAEVLHAVRDAATALTWDATAAGLIDVYHETCNEPPTTAGADERMGGLMRGDLSDVALRLVGAAGVLSPDLERPLLALAMHPHIGAPVFGAIKLGYRASYRLRRLGNGRRRA